VLLAPRRFEVARERLEIGPSGEGGFGTALCPAVRLRRALLRRLPALQLSFQICQRPVEILERRVGTALPPGVESVQIRPFGVHSKRLSATAAGEAGHLRSVRNESTRSRGCFNR